MSLTLSNLKPAKGSSRTRRRVGRGGKRGTYSGRGMKGQRSRSGGKSGLKLMGFGQTLRRIHKNRGFRSLQLKMQPVNLADLEKTFAAEAVIEPQALVKAGLISSVKGGVKVLGDGKLTKRLTVKAHGFSATAKRAIETAGGVAEVLVRAREVKAKALQEAVAAKKEARKSQA